MHAWTHPHRMVWQAAHLDNVVQCGAADLIYTTTDSRLGGAPVPWSQYFWEAFPAGSGPTDRTTYMFSYMDADSRR